MRDSIEFFFFNLLHTIARRFSFRAAGKIGAFLGAMVFVSTGFRKKTTLDNLSQAFPQAPAVQLRTIALGAYKSYGTVLLEMLWSGGQPAEVLKGVIRIPDRKRFDEVLTRGKGVVFVSGHFGNWEFYASPFTLHLGKPLTIIVHPQRNQKVNARINATRTQYGTAMVPMDRSVRTALKLLHEGGYVLLLGDQSGPKESLPVDFFGRPAATQRGAAAFSLRTGAPLIELFLVRQDDGIYDLMLEEIDCSGLGKYDEENVNELTRRHTAVLEKWIRRYPDQWLWMHKRWKHTEYYQSLHPLEESV